MTSAPLKKNAESVCNSHLLTKASDQTDSASSENVDDWNGDDVNLLGRIVLLVICGGLVDGLADQLKRIAGNIRNKSTETRKD